MGRRYEVEATGPFGNTVTMVLAKRWDDTQAIFCEECGFLRPSTYWPLSKVKGLHERGAGHKVRRLRAEAT